MLFLLNDAVLTIDAAMVPPMTSGQLARLSLAFICDQGRELFAAAPRLHLSHPEIGARLAALILAKQPTVNAALFVAPTARCKPSQVAFRLAQVDFDVMAALRDRQQAGTLSAYYADLQVWRRLAA